MLWFSVSRLAEKYYTCRRNYSSFIPVKFSYQSLTSSMRVTTVVVWITILVGVCNAFIPYVATGTFLICSISDIFPIKNAVDTLVRIGWHVIIGNSIALCLESSKRAIYGIYAPTLFDFCGIFNCVSILLSNIVICWHFHGYHGHVLARLKHLYLQGFVRRITNYAFQARKPYLPVKSTKLALSLPRLCMIYADKALPIFRIIQFNTGTCKTQEFPLGLLPTHDRWKWLYISHPVADHKVGLAPQALKGQGLCHESPWYLIFLVHPLACPISTPNVANHWPVAEIILPSKFSG